MDGIKLAPVNKTMKFWVPWKVRIDYTSDYKLLKKDFDGATFESKGRFLRSLEILTQ
jgi:hypothetical protein